MAAVKDEEEETLNKEISKSIDFYLTIAYWIALVSFIVALAAFLVVIFKPCCDTLSCCMKCKVQRKKKWKVDQNLDWFTKAEKKEQAKKEKLRIKKEKKDKAKNKKEGKKEKKKKKNENENETKEM